MKKLVQTLFMLCLTVPVMAQSKLYPQLFDLQDVELTEGPLRHAMLLNDSVLLQYSAGRLMQPFEKQAGITESGAAYKNWSGGIGSGLDGHVGGHYLSALAMGYAACPDAALKAALKERLDWCLGRLKEAQDKWDTHANAAMHGYVGGVPESENVWTGYARGNFEKYNRSWVAFYNVHKVFAGLRDAWLYADSEEARQMFLKLCDWGVNLIAGLTDAQVEQTLNIEHGGMNEMMADAYQMTGNEKYLTAAKRYSHKWLLNGMAQKKAATINNVHANTQVPKVIGFERVYQAAALSGGAAQGVGDYKTAARFFWDDVTGNRTIAVGGNSVNEWFPASTEYERFTTSIEGVETCNSYNMLKLSEALFADEHASKYADFYEGTMMNHIHSAQHPVTGGYVYFTSARPQHYRVYSQVDEAMWCCVGSGMENHTKYGQFIYTHHGDSLWVNLFVPSKLNWREKGVALTQQTKFPYTEATWLTVDKGGRFTLLVRQPAWVADGFYVAVNGTKVATAATDKGYVAITRDWKAGDHVQVHLPMQVTVEPLNYFDRYVAFKYGPILLGAKTGTDGLTGLFADDSRMGHVASGQQKDLYTAPLLIGSRSELAAAVEPVDKDALKFRINGYYNDPKFSDLQLQPFNTIHESRYMMYWMNVEGREWEEIRDMLQHREDSVQAIEARTIDYVIAGTQQSESDHFMQQENSNFGSYNGEYYRDGQGWFSYEMQTGEQADSVTLMVRYWGGDRNRTFDILIDGQLLTTVTLRGGRSEFVNAEYLIPAAMLAGKQKVTVKFAARNGSTAGGVYYVRICKQAPVVRQHEPYVFNAKDYEIGDGGRTSAVTYNEAANTFTMTMKTSEPNNISVQMKRSASGRYGILPSQHLMVVRGTQLRKGSGMSYLWWLNGDNRGTQVAPDWEIDDTNGALLVVWDLRNSDLTANMDFTTLQEITIGHFDAAFVNCFGLTSSAADRKSTITDIGYYSPQEAVDRYPALSAALGLQPSSIHAVSVTPTKAVYNLQGQRLKTPSRSGIYIVNGRKQVY